jgi:hypothetical protein
MNTKSSILAALTVAVLLPAATGCDTQDVRPNVLVSLPLDTTATPAPGLGSWLVIYTAKDDCGVGDSNCAWFNLRIDGKMAVWPGTYDYVEIFSVNQAGLIIPPGTHVIELVDRLTGTPLITTPPLDMRSDMLHNLAVFGPPGAVQQRWFVDDPALVPEGVSHTRVLNALAGGDPIQPVQCTDTGGVDCTALGAPVEHGGMFEAQLTEAELETFGWRWARPGVTDAVVNRTLLRQSGIAGDSGYVFHMPLRVQATGSGGNCPSCLESSF